MATIVRVVGMTALLALAGCEVAYEPEEAPSPTTTAPGAVGGTEGGATSSSDLEDATGSALDAAERRSGSHLGQARDAASRTVGALEERSRQIAGDEP